MREHGNDGPGDIARTPRIVAVPSTDGAGDATDTDLIFDFTGIQTLDVKTLSLLLTAQRHAVRDERTVWVAGLPKRVWDVLRAMGLDGYFRAFPGRGDARA